jgi:hypothetical protein
VKTQTLESRIQRAAEDFGCPVLRRAALEVGEMRAERDDYRSSYLAMYFMSAFMLGIGFVLGYAAPLVRAIAKAKGWL